MAAISVDGLRKVYQVRESRPGFGGAVRSLSAPVT